MFRNKPDPAVVKGEENRLAVIQYSCLLFKNSQDAQKAVVVEVLSQSVFWGYFKKALLLVTADNYTNL